MKEWIRQSNLIEGIDDPAEDEQSMMAWRWLRRQKKLTNAKVCHLHKLVTLNQLTGGFKGYYRDLTETNVRVGNHFPPHYSQVPFLMGAWLEYMDDHSPLNNHIQFEKIHPFVDGNGRVGRMLLWWDQLRRGEGLNVWYADNRQQYYKLFKEE